MTTIKTAVENTVYTISNENNTHKNGVTYKVYAENGQCTKAVKYVNGDESCEYNWSMISLPEAEENARYSGHESYTFYVKTWKEVDADAVVKYASQKFGQDEIRAYREENEDAEWAIVTAYEGENLVLENKRAGYKARSISLDLDFDKCIGVCTVTASVYFFDDYTKDVECARSQSVVFDTNKPHRAIMSAIAEAKKEFKALR